VSTLTASITTEGRGPARAGGAAEGVGTPSDPPTPVTPSRSPLTARRLGLALALLALAALVWSFGFEAAPPPAPEYALASPMIWRLERAMAATALLAVPAIFIAHLLAGRLPQRIGRDGVGWGPEGG
jgi:hypothetical protein